MPPKRRSSPARLIAPLALAACAIAFFSVLAMSGTDGGDGGGEKASEETTEARTTTTTPPPEPKPKASATYTVKVGDTLGEIAQTTGVEVARLQELNPELDPQALVSGQKIKLRE